MDLHELDVQVKNCRGCMLCCNKHHAPSWSDKSKYVMYTEYPYRKQPDFMKLFWELASEFSLEEDHFLQISTVQCSTQMNKRTGKCSRPSAYHRKECSKWFNEYFKMLNPKKMLAFGNIPMEQLTGEFRGISERHGEIIKPRINNRVVKTVLSLPPSTLRHDSKGEEKMRQVLKTFVEIK